MKRLRWFMAPPGVYAGLGFLIIAIGVTVLYFTAPDKTTAIARAPKPSESRFEIIASPGARMEGNTIEISSPTPETNYDLEPALKMKLTGKRRLVMSDQCTEDFEIRSKFEPVISHDNQDWIITFVRPSAEAKQSEK